MESEDNSPTKKWKQENKIDDRKSFTPREYQIEILETARKKNTIACLGTGTGKTFIAVMLIRETANAVRTPFLEGGKRIFFLVPTVPLVTQQAKTIEDHTDLIVKGYYGEMEVDSWNKDQWLEEFIKNEVLVMTAEIFRIIVDHVFISVNKIQLLIIDECHRAQGDHPYRQALKCFVNLSEDDMPRIFGLSASLLNGKCKPNKLENRLKDLEKTLRSTIITASDIIDLRKYGTDPNEFIIQYAKYENSADQLLQETDVLIKEFSGKKSNFENNDIFFHEDIVFFDKPLKSLKSLHKTLNALGPWCAHKAAEIYANEIESLLLRSTAEKYQCDLTRIREFLLYFMLMCKALDFSSSGISENMPNKLQRLLDIFFAAKNSPLCSVDPNLSIVEVGFDEDPEQHYQVLKQNREKCEEAQLCSLIFVEQRITAYVLCQWLKEVSQSCPGLEFINPEFVVGHGNAGIGETAMSEKAQQKKLKQFKDNKCNVLIATQVLEEGMDIRQCNLVIRFDPPIDFRSYVQSKGRARSKSSIYALLIEEGFEFSNRLLDLSNFKTIEKMLMEKCHERNMPTEEEIFEHMADSELPPYMPYGLDGPRITMTAAISLINRYCSSLPSDMATKLVPNWKIQVVDEENIEKEYECILKMPINSPLRKTIVSEAMKKKRLAKMSAALKACQLLDEIGELNEHLVPISCSVDKALEDELGKIEEEDGQGAIPGTNRRRQLYEKRVPIFLKEAKPLAGQPCYLHIIKMDLVFPLPKELNPRNRPIMNPANTSRGLAILSRKKLPPVNPFPIFTKHGKILITMKSVDDVKILSDHDIKEAEQFHRFLFSDALCIDDEKVFSPDIACASYYIVPINNGVRNPYEIDWNFMEKIKQDPYNCRKLKSLSSLEHTVFKENDFTDAVLLRSYKINRSPKDHRTFHHAIKIRHDLSPSSQFNYHSKSKTYCEYYYEKYGVTIKNACQPLIETVQTIGLHLWKPLYLSTKEIFDHKTDRSKSKQKHMDYMEYLVPELCIIHPFPSSFFNKVQCLPTVLFRLNELLLAEEIRQAVARDVFVGIVNMDNNFSWPVFHLETSDKDLTKYFLRIGVLKSESTNLTIPRDITKVGNKITSFEVKVDLKTHTGPSPSLLLQALTSRSSGDEFDLERLEMIGDSFLKYAMSVKTYIKYHAFDEGKLSKLRSRMIQNLNLYQRAKKKQLGQYLTTATFSCKQTWLPPCYTIEEYVDPKTLIKKSKKKRKEEKEDIEANPLHLYFTKQVISDKCIADSVEALIGSYLLSCGQQGALRFMAWIGLNPHLNIDLIESDLENWPPLPPNPIVTDEPNIPQRLAYLTNGFDRFEEIIHYKFKNRAYLLQAFTHPSYSYNNITDCYQRLEFLGDAVLDYLITRQLYEDPSGHSPGELTDLRSALVNNTYFASLAVHYKYHEYLKVLSPQLFRLLSDFVNILKSDPAFKFFETHRYYLEELECFELEEVEVPKALGDIFESVAGAIYLDSGMSLDTVWRVCYPMIEPAMRHLCEYVPKSPVRELLELLKTRTIFGDAITKGEKTYIEVIMPDGRKFHGVGPNKKVAKRSAAKRALVELKNEEKNWARLYSSS